LEVEINNSTPVSITKDAYQLVSGIIQSGMSVLSGTSQNNVISTLVYLHYYVLKFQTHFIRTVVVEDCDV